MLPFLSKYFEFLSAVSEKMFKSKLKLTKGATFPEGEIFVFVTVKWKISVVQFSCYFAVSHVMQKVKKKLNIFQVCPFFLLT